ncbi:hypothetical protein OH799_35285 [Nocardia sp. NBC_00881]|uniref:hypothetical protein n=1 Tax=Nocardia sp. NBC_00881 TaxID=2975995 RepID=UPI00386448D8|nr:hypothetical protein OH799_35285 [Nocardia sp. NBC_00881]
MVFVAIVVSMSACATSIPNQEAGEPVSAQTSPPWATDATSIPDTGGPPGQPVKTDSGRVPGAPIKIPGFIELGDDIDYLHHKAKADIDTACGGCVRVKREIGTDTTKTRCQYTGYKGAKSEPRESGVGEWLIIDRDSTLVLLSGTLPCTSGTATPIETATPPVSSTSSSATTTRSGSPAPTSSHAPTVRTTR